jgi:mannosyl-3-phosphoglycerate phosphatase
MNTATENSTAGLHNHWLIVSDLDGTLLDHYSYAHSEVDKLLSGLEARGVPLVLNSSKTFEEMLEIRRSLNNRHPFIVENGSAIFIPKGYFPAAPHSAEVRGDYWAIKLGVTRKTILAFLRSDSALHPAPYLSFSDATTEEIAQLTGLTREQAETARRRQYSEAILWRGGEEEKQAFIGRIRAAGLHTLQGGRFLHLLGRTDKGSATLALLDEYRRQTDQAYQLLASGDSPNDLEMLKVADIALIVRSPVQPPPQLPQHPRVIVSEQTGPAGWSQVVSQLFFPK